MLPKEKAKELIDKMYYTISNNGSYTGENSIPHKWEEGKKCALIAVEEIKEQLIQNIDNDVSTLHAIYWLKVKDEINKL